MEKASSKEKEKARKSVFILKTPFTYRATALAVFLIGWELYGRRTNPVLFTYPTAILRALGDMVWTGELFPFLLASLRVFSYGLGLSIVAGIGLGIAMARSRPLDWTLEPFLNALYATPMVALVPVMVLWFGFGITAKTVVVFLFAVFPILISTYQGVKDVDRDLMDVARSFCTSERQMWKHLIIPSATPFIISGLRLAVGRALIGMIIGEFYTSISGLGFMIVRYASTFETDRLFVPIVLLALMGIILTEAVKFIERRSMPWKDADRQ